MIDNNPNFFVNSYSSKAGEDVGVIEGQAPSIYIVKSYDEKSKAAFDGNKLLIQIWKIGDQVEYRVGMSGSNHEAFIGVNYGFTDFFSLNSREFILREGQIISTLTSRKYSFNDFVELLVMNHLSDREPHLRKAKVYISRKIVELTLWLNGDTLESKLPFFWQKDKVQSPEVSRDAVKPEMFFKYFDISKRIQLIGILIFIISIHLVNYIKAKHGLHLKSIVPLGDFSVSNPIVLVFVVLYLYFLEKISNVIYQSIVSMNGSKGILYGLYSYQFKGNEFVLEDIDLSFVGRIDNTIFRMAQKIKLKFAN